MLLWLAGIAVFTCTACGSGAAVEGIDRTARDTSGRGQEIALCVDQADLLEKRQFDE